MRECITLLLMLVFVNSHGQATIVGEVTDGENGVPLASVVGIDTSGTTIKYTFTDKNGKYQLDGLDPGRYTLLVRSLGFKEEGVEVEVNPTDHEIIKNILLSSQPFELDEVIVQPDRPIEVKKDTIVFDATIFSHGNEEVVEDLLRKIPGLRIDPDGTIKVGNKEVSKVMVEGDDIFEQGYKILTKNMPASPIDKVEVYLNYSNNELLKDIEESDRVALNLTLNEEAKRVWFGNIDFGYSVALKNQYELRGNLMNFGKKNKYYFLTNLNNVGYDATGDIDRLLRSGSIGEPYSIGDDQEVTRVVEFNLHQSDFKKDRINFNDSELYSLNSIFNPSEKLKVKVTGLFNSDDQGFFRSSTETFTANQLYFTNTENSSQNNDLSTIFGKVDVTYDLSEKEKLEGFTKYHYGLTDGVSALNFNGISTVQDLQTKNSLFDQKISYTKKVRENRVVLLTGRFITESSPQNFHIDRFLLHTLFPDSVEADNLNQSIINKMQFGGIEAHLIDRWKNNNLLEIRVGNQYRKDFLENEFLLLDGSKILDIPEDFQNRTTYFRNDLYLKSKFRMEVDNFALIGNLDIHQFSNKVEHHEFSANQNLFFVNPALGLDWSINQKNKIKASYVLNTTNASILEVHDNFILRSFRSFQAGTGELNQLDSSRFILDYELGEWSDRFFANMIFTYTKRSNYFSNTSLIEQEYSLAKKIMVGDREDYSLFSSLERYFKFMRSTLSMQFGFTQSSYKNIVNNSGYREIDFFDYYYGFQLRSGFSGFFNYHIGTKWTTNEIQFSTTNKFTNNLSFLNLTFMFNDYFDIQLEGERYYFGNLKSDNTYYFLDLDARFTLKPNKVIVALRGRNLFNINTFRNQSVSDISTSTTNYRLLPRSIILSLKYRF